MSIIHHTSPETATTVRVTVINSESEPWPIPADVAMVLDGALAKLTAPATQLVLKDPWLDRLYDVLGGRAETPPPAWSPGTTALVAEYAARTGGAL
ncbi:hypothetical protein [Streptomyces sp. LS1784]|uniref:hypothetical protein n=1 Tax=Streptomyces sp. LS1784 TaxID=2851533 RepID=UPI001CCBB9C6|nr:hypothetical protein [Streptomyces sp. LS1784]